MRVSTLFLNNCMKEELRNQRAQYLHLIQNIPEVVWRATEQGDAVFISQRIEELFGYTPEQVLREGSRLCFSRIHPEDCDRVKEAYGALFRTGQKFDVHYRIQHRDGHWMWWHDRAELAKDASSGIRYADGLLSDITHMKELEAKVQQSQKMEAIAQLAGGIAHDFNNLLHVISGYADLLAQDMEKDAKSREHTNKIKNAANRAKALTEQLLGFSRKQVQQVTVLNLNQTVLQLQPMLNRVLGNKGKLVLHLSGTPAWISADPGQIEQILMNLAFNARDAMPEGGKLTIETAHIAADDEHLRSRPDLTRGEHILFSITDTGKGMDAETLSRAFEPFFTTKATGERKGLGLATVYGIVKQSGGDIIATSEPARGTRFCIYLPAAARAEKHAAICSIAVPYRKGAETILLADDEPGIRDLVSTILEGLGYQVHCSCDGEAALEFVARFRGTIHLLLTDMVMPRCSGSELAQKLGRLVPEIKVLYMTGYTEDKLLRCQLQGRPASILRKPFTSDQLATAVSNAIKGPSFAHINSHLRLQTASHP